jgi:hypothetical protein
MKKNNRTSTVISFTNDFNEWCRQFNFGFMTPRPEQKRVYSPGEFDSLKFKKMVEKKKFA